MNFFTQTFKSAPFWFFLLVFFFLFFVERALAISEYTPLVLLPGINNSGAKSIGEYINAIYLLTISIGGLIGVIKISIAGVKYSMSDIVTSKEDAKEDIKGVLLGLAILLIPFIVLNTIYSGLTKINVLDSAPKTQLNEVKGGSATTSQGFIASLPKPPFDSNGVCEGTVSGSSCSVNCRTECTSRGGVPTLFPNQAGNVCPKIRCSK